MRLKIQDRRRPELVSDPAKFTPFRLLRSDLTQMKGGRVDVLTVYVSNPNRMIANGDAKVSVPLSAA